MIELVQCFAWGFSAMLAIGLAISLVYDLSCMLLKSLRRR